MHKVDECVFLLDEGMLFIGNTIQTAANLALKYLPLQG